MTRRADDWTGTGTIVIELDESGFRIVTMACPPKGTAQAMTDYAGRLVFEELAYVVTIGNLGSTLVEIGETLSKPTQMTMTVTP